MVLEITNRDIIYRDIEEIISSKLPWERLYNKSILITGGTSYIMNYFIRVLLKLNENIDANIKVTIMARSKEKVEHLFPDMNADVLNIIYGDICEAKSMDGGAADFVINAASPANPLMWAKAPFETLQTLTLGTMNVLEACRKWEVEKLMQISSSVVYGTDTQKGSRLREDNTGRFDFNELGNVYALGKITSEMLCNSFSQEYGLMYSVARPFIVYGPNMDISMKKAFTDFLYNVLDEKDIIMKSDGIAERSYCYVSDVVRGLFSILLKGEAGEAYNVANSHEIVSIKKLADTFALLSEGKSKVICNVPRIDRDYLNVKIDSMIADTTKLEALGWESKVNLKEGIRRTLNCYKQNY